jgi:hypothetical protein
MMCILPSGYDQAIGLRFLIGCQSAYHFNRDKVVLLQGGNADFSRDILSNQAQSLSYG